MMPAMRAAWLTIVAAALAIGVAHAAPKPAAPPPPPAPGGHQLTAADLEAFLDGFMPYARRRGDVAGTVVTVVKDGQVLFEKGYGFADVKAQKPVDPATTLFRPGSVSKLFTWTAVMQQVEAGKIDLDADINKYLDFQIPPAFGKPITMRDLMTHTPGFEEAIKNLMYEGSRKPRPLGAALKAWVPTRIFPPGDVAAYSNYGASLAGYIVERVSGERFESYIQDHIFTPLGMTHATFEQPLPKTLAGDMSKGYRLGSGEPHGFEVIEMSPAGALSASGDAMTKFMLAYLNGGELDGKRILSAKSIEAMFANQHQIMPELPGMGLGFFRMDANGHAVTGHGGDTQYFHSELFLIPDAHAGVFFSQNSAGRDGGLLRGPLQEAFMDRYFPAPPAAELPAAKTAKADAARIAGRYLVSRRSDSNFLRIGALFSQFDVSADKDGIVHADGLKDLDGNPIAWREVGPLRWQQVHGSHVLLAREKHGEIKEIATDMVPAIITITRAPLWRNANWSVPVLIVTLLFLVITVVMWPGKALLRWNYGRSFPLSGREAMLYRATRMVALIDLAVLCGWLAFLSLGSLDLSYFSTKGDPAIWSLYALGAAGVVGTIFPVLAFFEGLGSRDQSIWAKFVNFLVMLTCLSVAWFAVTGKLVGWTVNY